MARRPTVDTESVAQDQLRAFVERIMRMREEARAINDDIREIYAEAKGNGFDKTVLGKLVLYVEKRRKDEPSTLEQEALFDLYLEAFYERLSRTHAHEANNSPAKVSTGNAVSPTPSGVLGAEDRKHPKHDGSGEASRLSDGSGPVAPNHATHGGPADGAEPDLAPVSSATPIDRAAEGSLETGSVASGKRPEGEPVKPEAGAVSDVGAGESPATFRPDKPVNAPRTAADNARMIRPWCLHADDLPKCGGQGRKHCFTCLKAHADEVGEAA